MRSSSCLWLFVAAVWCAALSAHAQDAATSKAAPAKDAFEAARRLGRGINLGNALEAPREGEWGVTLKEEYFTTIREAGFNSVRLPVKWSAHAAKEAPYTIDRAFFERIDWAIAQAKKNDLVIIVNMHHYDEIHHDPDAHADRFLGLWTQIAERYKDEPPSVYFELLNEPSRKLSDDAWNKLFPSALAIVRKTNPTRPVIVGPSQWNSVDHLDRLRLPDDDKWLIATFHYYLPYEFTHQGAPWDSNARQWLGKRWPENEAQAKQLADHFAKAAAWGKEQKRPLFLGEFGVYSAAAMDQRVRWTKAVVAEAEKHDIAWSYWEFCSGFGAYDPQAETWRRPLLEALLGK